VHNNQGIACPSCCILLCVCNSNIHTFFNVVCYMNRNNMDKQVMKCYLAAIFIEIHYRYVASFLIEI